MKTIWFEGTKTAEEKAKVKEKVLNNKIVLDILVKILYNMDKRVETTVLVDYDTPSWSHKQAHLNGERAMLRRIIDIVNITTDDPR